MKIAKAGGIAIVDERLISCRISKTQGSQAIRDRLNPEAFFLAMNEYEGLIKTHKNRHYFIAAQIKDLTIRALNYSDRQDIKQSMELIKQSFSLYVNDVRKLLFSGIAFGCLMIQCGVWIVNILPFKLLRKFYKKMVWRLVIAKKRMISY